MEDGGISSILSMADNTNYYILRNMQITIRFMCPLFGSFVDPMFCCVPLGETLDPRLVWLLAQIRRESFLVIKKGKYISHV